MRLKAGGSRMVSWLAEPIQNSIPSLQGHITSHPWKSGLIPRLFPPLAVQTIHLDRDQCPDRVIDRKRNGPPVGCSVECVVYGIRAYFTGNAGPWITLDVIF